MRAASLSYKARICREITSASSSSSLCPVVFTVLSFEVQATERPFAMTAASRAAVRAE